mmetsp:Transcript_59800/g.136697  ORF Transcript_59800/g.136697 Transcript_59800/m.136697 type:complete len:252 (-) Transcript_59800:41-796(-)
MVKNAPAPRCAAGAAPGGSGAVAVRSPCRSAGRALSEGAPPKLAAGSRPGAPHSTLEPREGAIPEACAYWSQLWAGLSSPASFLLLYSAICFSCSICSSAISRGVFDVDLMSRATTPSMMPSSTPPITALRLAAFQPPRAASTPPVRKPEAMAFQWSSRLLMYCSEQSKHENVPPQTAKLPPRIGARFLALYMAPWSLSPAGEWRAPFTKCHTNPPTAPMPKAPPRSSTMRSGHGSRPRSASPGSNPRVMA